MTPIIALAAAQGIAAAGGSIKAAIAGLYHVGGDLNEFIDRHIGEMVASPNPTVSRTGRVLEGAKFGFGIGYVVPVLIIAAGQFILGNTLSAVTTLAGAATLTNPVAMTCASVGAIYYGWSALTSGERDDISERLCKDLEIGIEMVKAVLAFVLSRTRDLLNSDNFKELKAMISGAAAVFGETLGSVTGRVRDRFSDSVSSVQVKSAMVHGTVVKAVRQRLRKMD